MRLLCLSDRPPDRRLLRALDELGHAVETDRADEDGAAVAAQGDWVLVLADLTDPQPAWLTALAKAAAAPVLVIGPPQARLRAAALRAGADAWLDRPVSALELGARLEALTRPTATAATGLRLSAPERAAWLDGRRILLSRPAFVLLQRLASRPGAVFGPEALAAALGADLAEAGSGSIRRGVADLRAALAEAGADDWIETVRGHGYRLKAERGGD